jgi:hypothetical protein
MWRNEKMKVKVKIKEIKRKKVYYCIVEEIEVPDNITDKQVDDLLAKKTDGKDYMWSYKDSLLDLDCCE